MYKDMLDYLEEGSIGDFKLEKFVIKPDNIRAITRGMFPGEYISLKEENTLLMSDTPMEKRTNQHFIDNAHGDVLIAGLGIGLIILPIQDKEVVKTITVVEKNKEVIELVGKQLPLNEKVRIINKDIYKWTPEYRYDTIYLDIWDFINSDVYEEEMLPLKKKYIKHLKCKSKSPQAFIRCWAEEEAKNSISLF